MKRAETPFYARLRKMAGMALRMDIPIPGPIRPVVRLAYHAHYGMWGAFRWFVASFYATPLFKARCAAVGRGFHAFLLPHVIGHAVIRVGDDVRFQGKIAIETGHMYDQPTLTIGNRVSIGHQSAFFLSREIVVEDGVYIAGQCIIADNDGHPRDPEMRAKGLPAPKEEIAPVRIGRNAWLAHGCRIRKGVTIGEGVIVSTNSVVVRDVPPFCIVMGNPAKVVGFANPGSS